MKDLFKRFAEFGSLIFIHADIHSCQSLDEIFSVGQYGVNIFFQQYILCVAGVFDYTCAGRLRAEFKSLENGAVFFRVVFVFAFLRFRFFFSERVFQIIVQGFYRIVFRRRGLFFNRLEINIHAVAFFEARQYLVLLSVFVKARPTGSNDNGSFERKVFKPADIYLYFGFLGDAFFGAEHGDKTAHNGGIYLFFRRRKF